MRSVDFRLYLITDRRLMEDEQLFFAGVESALRSGVTALQLREKDLATRELLDMSFRMRKLTRQYGAQLFINDRADIALCVEAEGVHIGQSGMPVHAVRKVVGERMLIGASTHTVEEALTAQREGADFITYGPLYDTPSKRQYGPPVGLESLQRVRKNVTVPILGIGGIKATDVMAVVRAGAEGVAVVSGILGDPDIEAASRNYVRLVGEKI